MEVAGAGAGTEAGVQASKTALRICCKISLEYLGTLVAVARASAIGSFVFEGPADWLNSLSPDLGGGEELERATKGEAMEKRF